MDPELETIDGVVTEDSAPASEETQEAAGLIVDKTSSVIDALPNDTVDELCSLFGCTREALEILLSSTSADPRHILSLVSALSPSYVAIKLRFETRKKGEVGGAACVVAEGRSGELVDTTMWVSGRELPASFSIHSDWEAVRNGIQKMGSNPDRALFPKVLQLLKEVFSPTAVNSLFSTPPKKEDVISALEKAFLMVYHSEITFELAVETFNKARLETGGLGDVGSPAPSDSEPEVPLNATMAKVQINCKPMLDPVRGRPVSEIVPGEYIYVEVQKTGALSSVIEKILSRAGEHPAFQVTSVERLPSGQFLIKLSISKGIDGLARVSADLRLKTVPLFSMKGAGGEFSAITKRMLPGFVFAAALALLLYLLHRS
ncbi:MAG: hypothetical protein WCY56_04940 [Aminobacteriaceae bacterium]